LIAYSLGILDSEQMDFCPRLINKFWDEEFNKEFEYGDYELLDEYLMETYQNVDDWEQMTFYNIDSFKNEKYDCNSIIIQLTKPLNEYWEEIVVRRIKKFFEVDTCDEWCKDSNRKMTGLYLVDGDDNIIKEYK